MPKKVIMYSPEREAEIRAIRDSIEHWKEDMLRRLQNGEKIEKRGDAFHWENGDEVKCYDVDCSLCSLVHDDCTECPLFQSGQGCHTENSPYIQFKSNPCLETVQNMVLVLQGLLVKYLTEEEIKKHKETKPTKIEGFQVWQMDSSEEKNACYHLILSIENGNVKHLCLRDIEIWSNDEEYFRRGYVFCPNAKIEVTNDRK